MVTEAERLVFIRDADEVIKAGEQWYEFLKAEHEIEKKYETGDFIIINVENGEYVIDADEIAASQKANATFPEDAKCFVRMIVGPHPHIHLSITPDGVVT